MTVNNVKPHQNSVKNGTKTKKKFHTWIFFFFLNWVSVYIMDQNSRGSFERPLWFSRQKFATFVQFLEDFFFFFNIARLTLSRKTLFQEIQSRPVISNSADSKSPLFRRESEFLWIYPHFFNHLLSAISNSALMQWTKSIRQGTDGKHIAF